MLVSRKYKLSGKRLKWQAFFFKCECSQGRKVDTKGMPQALPGLVRRSDPAEIAHVAPAISLGIGIDYFPIKTRLWSANVVAVMHHRRSIYNKNDGLALTGFPYPRDNAVFGIVKINPLESFVTIVQVPKRRFTFIEIIQMLNQAACPIVQRRLH